MYFARLITAFTPLIALVGCNPPPPPVHTDPLKVQQLARIPIPPSATNVMCRTDSDDQSWFPAPDYATWGRFDIPAADLPKVLDRMPKDEKPKPHSGGPGFGHPAVAEGWWHPEQLKNPQEASWSEPGFAYRLLFGGSDQDGTLTVYFFNHSM